MADSVFEPEVKRGLQWLLEMSGGAFPNIGIECKKTLSARLSFDRLSDHQITSLLLFERYGIARKLIVSQGFGASRRFTGDTPFDFLLVGAGAGILLVNFRFTKSSPRKDLPKGLNKCFAVRITDYVKAKAAAIDRGEASLDFSWFLENSIECPRIRIKKANGLTEGAWDFEPLVKAIVTER